MYIECDGLPKEEWETKFIQNANKQQFISHVFSHRLRSSHSFLLLFFFICPSSLWDHFIQFVLNYINRHYCITIEHTLYLCGCYSVVPLFFSSFFSVRSIVLYCLFLFFSFFLFFFSLQNIVIIVINCWCRYSCGCYCSYCYCCYRGRRRRRCHHHRSILSILYSIQIEFNWAWRRN